MEAKAARVGAQQKERADGCYDSRLILCAYSWVAGCSPFVGDSPPAPHYSAEGGIRPIIPPRGTHRRARPARQPPAPPATTPTAPSAAASPPAVHAPPTAATHFHPRAVLSGTNPPQLAPPVALPPPPSWPARSVPVLTSAQMAESSGNRWPATELTATLREEMLQSPVAAHSTLEASASAGKAPLAQASAHTPSTAASALCHDRRDDSASCGSSAHEQEEVEEISVSSASVQSPRARLRVRSEEGQDSRHRRHRHHHHRVVHAGYSGKDSATPNVAASGRGDANSLQQLIGDDNHHHRCCHRPCHHRHKRSHRSRVVRASSSPCSVGQASSRERGVALRVRASASFSPTATTATITTAATATATTSPNNIGDADHYRGAPPLAASSAAHGCRAGSGSTHNTVAQPASCPRATRHRTLPYGPAGRGEVEEGKVDMNRRRAAEHASSGADIPKSEASLVVGTAATTVPAMRRRPARSRRRREAEVPPTSHSQQRGVVETESETAALGDAARGKATESNVRIRSRPLAAPERPACTGAEKLAATVCSPASTPQADVPEGTVAPVVPVPESTVAAVIATSPTTRSEGHLPTAPLEHVELSATAAESGNGCIPAAEAVAPTPGEVLPVLPAPSGTSPQLHLALLLQTQPQPAESPAPRPPSSPQSPQGSPTVRHAATSAAPSVTTPAAPSPPVGGAPPPTLPPSASAAPLPATPPAPIPTGPADVTASTTATVGTPGSEERAARADERQKPDAADSSGGPRSPRPEQQRVGAEAQPRQQAGGDNNENADRRAAPLARRPPALRVVPLGPPTPLATPCPTPTVATTSPPARRLAAPPPPLVAAALPPPPARPYRKIAHLPISSPRPPAAPALTGGTAATSSVATLSTPGGPSTTSPLPPWRTSDTTTAPEASGARMSASATTVAIAAAPPSGGVTGTTAAAIAGNQLPSPAASPPAPVPVTACARRSGELCMGVLLIAPDGTVVPLSDEEVARRRDDAARAVEAAVEAAGGVIAGGARPRGGLPLPKVCCA